MCDLQTIKGCVSTQLHYHLQHVVDTKWCLHLVQAPHDLPVAPAAPATKNLPGLLVYPGKLTRVASGHYGVWGVSPAQAIFKKNDKNGWERIQGDLKDISVGKNSIWGVNKHNDIYTYSSGKWKHIPGKLMQVLNPLLNYHIPTLLFQDFCQWVWWFCCLGCQFWPKDF